MLLVFVVTILPLRPLIFAHRGDSSRFPENTLAAFEAALGLGVDGIELDVRVTRDGEVVVFHDDDLRRMTGRRGRIAELDWATLAGQRVAGREPIARLGEALALTRGRAIVQVEIKAGVPLEPVVRTIVGAGAAEWVVVASFEAEIVSAAARLAPSVPRMLISEGKAPAPMLAGQVAALGAGGISVNRRAVDSAGWVRAFHTRGLAVWSWTVNAAADARRLAAFGVDALLGDDPGLLRRATETGMNGANS